MRTGERVDPEAARTWVDSGLAACMRRVNRAYLVRELLLTLLVCLSVALLLRVAVRGYVVQGESMWPNLHAGDALLVDTLAYHFAAPARGDLVVFRFPLPGVDRELVKRVIGLPGDVVTIRPGQVSINGRPLREPYVRNVDGYWYGPRRVPAGSYFVLGDNREVAGRQISYDSHQWGFLPARDLEGRVMLVYWPLGDFRLFTF